MPYALPIEQILKGHTQSLFQALRHLQQLCDQPDLTSTPTPQVSTIEHHLTQPQLLDLVQESNSYQNAVKPQQAATQPNSARPLLGALLTTHSAQLHDDLRSSQRLVDTMLSRLLMQCRPHPDIAESSHQCTLVLITRLLTRPDILIHAGHPLCKLIQQLFQQIAVWEPVGGKAGKRFIDWLQNLTHQLISLDINSSATIAEWQQGLQQLTDQDISRRLVLEQRQLETYQAHDNLEAARQTVTDYLNKRLSGQCLPVETGVFIRQRLRSDLQFMLIHQGVECPQWKRWQRLIQVLSWAFSGDQPHKVNTLLPPLIEQLAPIADQQDTDYWRFFPAETDINDHYRNFFTQLQLDFLKALTQQPLDCESFPPLDTADTTTGSQVHAVIDQQLIDDLSQYQHGHLFFVQQSLAGTESNFYWAKAKLLDKNPLHDRILLTRYSGQKLADYTFDQFTLGLASRVIRPLNVSSLYGSTLLATLRQLDKQFQHQQKLNQQLQEEQMARGKAAHKASQEAIALQQTPVSPGRDSTNQLDGEQDLEYQTLLDSLHVGAWLQLQQAGVDPIKMKLAVKLQASNKYIFTDHLGQRLGDYSRTELLHLLAGQQLRILSQGTNFENSLEEIVRGLRKPSA